MPEGGGVRRGGQEGGSGGGSGGWVRRGGEIRSNAHKGVISKLSAVVAPTKYL